MREAWSELIGRFEGRLLAYVESRTRNRTAAEDVVQETFIGFLTSLPNFDPRRPLEGYLFSIAAHKLTDYLRREGRRPTLPLVPAGATPSGWEPAGSARPASSIARSGERRHLEEAALVDGAGRADRAFPPPGAVGEARMRGTAVRARLDQQGGRGKAGDRASRRWPITSSSSWRSFAPRSGRKDCRKMFFPSCINDTSFPRSALQERRVLFF